jgi:hypothetical protein
VSLAVLILTSTATRAQTVAPELPQPAAPTLAEHMEGEAPPVGTVQDLQQRLRNGVVATLRSTRNGNFGAQLFLDRTDGTYFAAMLQQTGFWRVMETSDEARAESAYTAMIKQTEMLSGAELQRAHLDAQRLRLEQEIDEANARKDSLRADLDVAKEQARLSAERERATRTQLDELQVQQRAEQIQLRNLQQQVRQMTRQENSGIPGRVSGRARSRTVHHTHDSDWNPATKRRR